MILVLTICWFGREQPSILFSRTDCRNRKVLRISPHLWIANNPPCPPPSSHITRSCWTTLLPIKLKRETTGTTLLTFRLWLAGVEDGESDWHTYTLGGRHRALEVCQIAWHRPISQTIPRTERNRRRQGEGNILLFRTQKEHCIYYLFSPKKRGSRSVTSRVVVHIPASHFCIRDRERCPATALRANDTTMALLHVSSLFSENRLFYRLFFFALLPPSQVVLSSSPYPASHCMCPLACAHLHAKERAQMCVGAVVPL